MLIVPSAVSVTLIHRPGESSYRSGQIGHYREGSGWRQAIDHARVGDGRSVKSVEAL
jgi:hypothetical protein